MLPPLLDSDEGVPPQTDDRGPVDEPMDDLPEERELEDETTELAPEIRCLS